MATDATKDKRTRDRRRKAKNLELATEEVESLNRIDKFIPAGNAIKSKVLSPEDAAQSRVSICVRVCVHVYACVCVRLSATLHPVLSPNSIIIIIMSIVINASQCKS